jgi:undecaprenyl-diphosphatase
VTLTAGRAARLTRGAAARFSFLLATPITLGAVLVEARQLSGAVPAELAVGIATSAVVGLIAIQGLLHWIERGGVGVFFAYRTILALVIVLQWIRR